MQRSANFLQLLNSSGKLNVNICFGNPTLRKENIGCNWCAKNRRCEFLMIRGLMGVVDQRRMNVWTGECGLKCNFFSKSLEKHYKCSLFNLSLSDKKEPKKDEFRRKDRTGLRRRGGDVGSDGDPSEQEQHTLIQQHAKVRGQVVLILLWTACRSSSEYSSSSAAVLASSTPPSMLGVPSGKESSSVLMAWKASDRRRDIWHWWGAESSTEEPLTWKKNIRVNRPEGWIKQLTVFTGV